MNLCRHPIWIFLQSLEVTTLDGEHDNSYTRHFEHTTFRTKTKSRRFVQKPQPNISYKNQKNRHFVQNPKPDISDKNQNTKFRKKTKTRHFVQKRNPTFRTKTKPDTSYKNIMITYPLDFTSPQLSCKKLCGIFFKMFYYRH